MAILKFTGKMIRKEYITPTVFEIEFEPTISVPLEPGQFIMIKFKDPENNEKTLSRAYSVASAPESKTLKLCIKLVEGGKGTHFLNSLKEGETVDLTGTYGKFTYKTKSNRIPFFISTGTGIAPYLAMVDSLLFQKNPPQKAFCLLGVRTEDEILYQKKFSKIPFMNFISTVSRPSDKWTGLKGRVTDYLKKLDSNFPWTDTDFYLCGNGDMIQEAKKILEDKSVPKENIYQEIYFS